MAKDIPKKVREEVLARDSIDGTPCCIYCGRPQTEYESLHLHHVVRRSQLGKHEAKNLVSLCYRCHGRIHNGDMGLQTFCKAFLEEKL